MFSDKKQTKDLVLKLQKIHIDNFFIYQPYSQTLTTKNLTKGKKYICFSSLSPMTDVWRLSSKFFMTNMIFRSNLGVICFRPEIQIFFVKKQTKYSKPWTRYSQCLNGFCRLAENTQNAPTFFGPICLPKPKRLGFLKKTSVWVSVCDHYQPHVKNLPKFQLSFCIRSIEVS